MQLKTGILLTPTPKTLDIFECFYRRKNVRLGVNGNRWLYNSMSNYDSRWNIKSQLAISTLVT